MFWSSGYFIATTGKVSAKTLKHLRAKADMIGRHLIPRTEVPQVFMPQIFYKALTTCTGLSSLLAYAEGALTEIIPLLKVRLS